MNTEKVSKYHKALIGNAAMWLIIRKSDHMMGVIAKIDKSFTAIMQAFKEQNSNPEDYEMFRIALHKARNTPTWQRMQGLAAAASWPYPDVKTQRHVLAYREGVPAMMDSIVRGKVDVPTDANGMCYPKPNGGKRILPSIYTRIKQWWMRANGVTVEVVDMNDGHLENTMKLLQESHGNVIAKSTELLGKMANHFHNQPAVVQQLEDLCMAMQKVDVDAMYPIFKELATEAAQRKATPAMLVAVNPAWFEDGELNWGDK